MPTWSVGLETRASAQRAAKWGAIACFFQSAREMLGNFLTVSLSGKPLDLAVVWFIGANLFAIFLLIAGIRLWRRAGWIWGSLAALLVLVELAMSLLDPRWVTNAYQPIIATVTSFASIAATAALVASLLVKLVLFVLISNGVRGALALRKLGDRDDLGRVFG